MPVINICFLCPHHVSPHLNSADDIAKKIAKKKKYRTKKSRGANRQQAVWMIASLEERQVHFSQVPFTAFTLRTVFYIFFIYRVARRPLPNWYSPNANLRRPIPHCFIHFSDFVMVNTQVDVFNFEMNVIGEFPRRFQWRPAVWVPLFTHCSYILSVSMRIHFVFISFFCRSGVN